MLKQSEELQRRLADRRRKAFDIKSCKNSNAKSFFKFESSNLTNKNDKSIVKQANGLNNVSIIDNNMSIGLISEDEIFNTEPSTLNMISKIEEESYKPKLHIDTSLTDEGEEEEEESEDEQIEQNVISIWKECEKVFETLHSEKEDATSQFLEDFTTDKFEKIAMLKSEFKSQVKRIHDDHEKQLAESDFKAKLHDLEKELSSIRSKGLTEIKEKFVRRKQSIVGKLDMESAKDKLKQSLNTSRSFHMNAATPSAHSFYLSPNEFPTQKKAQQKSPVELANNHPLFPKSLVTPTGMIYNMPKTPNQPTKRGFNFDFTSSEAKARQLMQ